jgi:hypothetical protein
MVIRRAQMESFQAALNAQADVRMAEYARRRFPEKFRATPDDELVALAAAVRKDARPHGIVDEPDVATALDLTVMYGPDFYSADWARDVLAVSDWSGAQKADALRSRVRRQTPGF